jgi:SAM-dependent methyltransferase
MVATRRRRASDGGAASHAEVLVCWQCGGRLRLSDESLVCPKRHSYPRTRGFFDLWPSDKPLPRVDVFSTPYGLLYDTGIKERPLARIAGRLGWGADPTPIFDLMDEAVKCDPGQVLLDVPVGGGPTLRSAPGRMRGTYIGIDISPRMLERAAVEVAAEELTGVILVRADATAMPVADRSVDRVLSFNGLHVMPDKQAVLAEFHRVLKPGGEVVGSAVVVNANRAWMRATGFFHPADEAELIATARAAGFRNWTQARTGSLLTFRARRTA